MAKGEVATFMLWVLRGAEVKSHRGFGSSRYSPGFVEPIWGEITEQGYNQQAWVVRDLGSGSNSLLSKLLNPTGFQFLHLLNVSSSPSRRVAKML